jgi:hypothetical protein
MTDEELMQSTQEEQEFFLKCVKGFPGLEGFSGTGYDAKGERIPWGSGPHNVKAYREIIEMVKPKKILEIGFNMGYATAVFMALCDCIMVSLDVSDKAETLAAADILHERYPERFDFFCIDSKEAYNLAKHIPYKFDMIFIDGNHLEDYVTNDIKVGLTFGAKWFVLDDWQPNFGPGVQISAAKFPLEIVKVFGNTALLKVKE